jgi:hypothetical protein
MAVTAIINGWLGAALKREMRKETDFGFVLRMDWAGLQRLRVLRVCDSPRWMEKTCTHVTAPTQTKNFELESCNNRLLSFLFDPLKHDKKSRFTAKSYYSKTWCLFEGWKLENKNQLPVIKSEFGYKHDQPIGPPPYPKKYYLPTDSLFNVWPSENAPQPGVLQCLWRQHHWPAFACLSAIRRIDAQK